MREPKPMQELHRVREHLYEEQKELSAKELLAKVHAEADAASKRLGVKLRKGKKVA